MVFDVHVQPLTVRASSKNDFFFLPACFIDYCVINCLNTSSPKRFTFNKNCSIDCCVTNCLNIPKCFTLKKKLIIQKIVNLQLGFMTKLCKMV